MVGERRASAVALVLGAACSVQGGAAVAKSLFSELGPPGVVFLRLLFGSAALWAIARPRLAGRPWREPGLVVALGAHVFRVGLSLEPAVAALAGVIFLHEHLSVRAWIAIALVVLASAGAGSRYSPPGPPDA
jgi:threonine/homoserine efflux transporter RhtA